MADERKTEVRRDGTVVRSEGRRAGRGGAMLGVVVLLMMAAGLACLAAVVMLSGCAAQAVVDESSPRCAGASVAAGSDLTESSQYIEARIAFDKPVELAGDAAGDFEVTLDGEPLDERTMRLEVQADGQDVVVRAVAAEGADGSSPSVYFAVYDGLMRIAPASEDGGLAHVKEQGGASNAVMEAPLEFTVPSGVQIEKLDAGAADPAAGEGAWVTFDIAQFAQLRSCTWFWFADGLPIVMEHNHEFARDLPQTVADRFVQTVETLHADELEAECDGSVVTVRAVEPVEGQQLDVRLCEGIGARPAEGVPGDGALEAVFEGGAFVPTSDEGGA